MTSPPPSPDLELWDIVEEHRDEAEFLLEMRRGCLLSPLYTLDEVESLVEQRLLAHIDALVVGGAAVAERVLLPCIQEDGAPRGAVTAAGLALLSGERPANGLRLIVEALATADATRREALAEALRLSGQPALPALVCKALAKVEAAPARAALFDALAAHQADPGELLADALESRDPVVRAAALRSVAAAARGDCLRAVDRNLGSEEVEVRDAAIEAGLVLGSSYAWEACRSFGPHPSARDAQRLLLAALLGSAGKVRKHLDEPAARRDVVWALGFGGRNEDVEDLLALLRDQEQAVAKLAGEAFCAITGFRQESGEEPAQADEAESEAESETEAESEADREEAEALPPLAEDDLDADLAPGAIDELPLVDPDAARAWWQDNRERFAGAERWLDGLPFGADALRRALAGGPMRRRHALARALRIASAGRYSVSTSALASRQREQLALLASLRPAELSKRF